MLIPYLVLTQWPGQWSRLLPHQGDKGRCCAFAALQRALQGLQDVPPYGLREVLAWSPRGLLMKQTLRTTGASGAKATPLL